MAGTQCSIAEQNLVLTDSPGRRGNACLMFLTSGPQEDQILCSPHLPGVGENFLVVLPTGQHIVKLLLVSKQLKYYNIKQLIKLNHFFSDSKSYFTEFTKWK